MVYPVAKGGRSDRSVVGPRFRDYRRPVEALASDIEGFYTALGSPIALSCWLLYKYGEHDQLATKGISPHQYIDGETFRLDYCAVSYLSKFPFLDTTFDTKQAALDAFSASEQRCASTNKYLRDAFSRSENLENELILSIQARKIASILGEVRVEEILPMGAFGPGSTFCISGKDTSSSRKYAEGRDITRGAYALFGETMKLYSPSWTAWSIPSFVEGCSVSTVPKNAKTDRTIAIEPSLNSWLQLAVGRTIRGKLRFSGYDLNSDKRNRDLARHGARTGNVATLDFKSASNTISIAVVERLLPPRWFLLLDAIRSHNYRLNGKWVRSEMFSTMGNGFTFELESLIFVTAALAVAEYKRYQDRFIAIFGDDLTCSVKMAPAVERYVTYLGFELNSEKSYFSGSFRESCGDHYFDTLNCKPLYLRDRVRTLAQTYDYCNRLLLLAHRFTQEVGLDRRFRRLWNETCQAIPKALQLKGPAQYGSSVLFSDRSPVELGIRRHKHWDGWVFDHLSAKSVTIEHVGEGHFLSQLRSNECRHTTPYRESSGAVVGRLRDVAFTFSFIRSSLGNDVPLRGLVSMRVSRQGFSSQWYDFGGWC